MHLGVQSGKLWDSLPMRKFAVSILIKGLLLHYEGGDAWQVVLI